jgi:GAF domain-containing protein
VDASSKPKVADLHANEAERLHALRSYGILDSASEASFDDITKIASYVCQTPVALISLVDEGRQWFKSELGFGKRETPLEQSICAHALLEHSFLEVEDTTKDPRFDCNPCCAPPTACRSAPSACSTTSRACCRRSSAKCSARSPAR